VEQAHSIVETDWREAEKLAKEALDLNPAHPMAKTIKTLILDHKKETFVEECVSQARKMQTAADLAGALSRIQEDYPVIPAIPGCFRFRKRCSETCRPSAVKFAGAMWKNCAASRLKSILPRSPQSRRWANAFELLRKSILRMEKY